MSKLLTADDLTIDALADEHAELCEEVARYRELALAALDQLTEIRQQLTLWQARHQALVEELRHGATRARRLSDP